MQMWFSEYHTKNVKLSIRTDKQLFSTESDYQRIDVFQSPEFGRFLTLNGNILFSQADEFVYNEMVVHVPMSVHPNAKKVLIIGGVDGGVAGEFRHYPEIEEIDIVDPDKVLFDVCKEYFPETGEGFSDTRVKIFYEDGLRFLRKCNNEYDIIINDSIDPFGYTEGLFTREFYGACYRALKEDGIMVYQHGSPFYDEDEEACRSMHRKVYKSFPISRVYQAHIPTVAAGYWLFGFASKKYHPVHDFDKQRWKAKKIKTWYYTANLHIGAFLLPKYVEDLLEEEEGR